MPRGKFKPFFFSIAHRHSAVIFVHRRAFRTGSQPTLRTGSQPTLRTGSQPTKLQPVEVHFFSSPPLCSLVFSAQVRTYVQTLSRLLCEWGRCTIDTAVYVVQTVLLHNRHCSACCATDCGCTTGTAVLAVQTPCVAQQALQCLLCKHRMLHSRHCSACCANNVRMLHSRHCNACSANPACMLQTAGTAMPAVQTPYVAQQALQ